MRPPISAADLLRAFAAVGPKTDEERRAIADLLGFDRQAPPTMKDAHVVELGAPKEQTSVQSPINPTPVSNPDSARATATGGFRISGPRPVPKSQLDWLMSGPALQARPMGRAHSPAPLFRPQWTRAILAASLSVRRDIGPPDLARAVETIARGVALQALPRSLSG